MVWGMGVGCLGYELLSEWFGVWAMVYMVWGMSYGLNGFGYEVWFEFFVV